MGLSQNSTLSRNRGVGFFSTVFRAIGTKLSLLYNNGRNPTTLCHGDPQAKDSPVRVPQV